jgi:hypothetical protein
VSLHRGTLRVEEGGAMVDGGLMVGTGGLEVQVRMAVMRTMMIIMMVMMMMRSLLTHARFAKCERR